MPQKIVVNGVEVRVVSYDDVHEYFAQEHDQHPIRNTDAVFRAIVRATKNVTAIHLNCGKVFGECRCENQLSPSGRDYLINIWEVSQLAGERKQIIRGLLQQWVVAQSQLGGVVLRDITANLQSFKWKVFDAIRALARA